MLRLISGDGTPKYQDGERHFHAETGPFLGGTG